MTQGQTYQPSPRRGEDLSDDLVDSDMLGHQPSIPRAGQVKSATDGSRPARDLLAGLGSVLSLFLHPTRSGSGRIVFLGGGFAFLIWCIGQLAPASFLGNSPGPRVMQYAAALGFGMGGVLMWKALRERDSHLFERLHAMVLIITLLSLGELAFPGVGMAIGAPFLTGYGAAAFAVLLGRVLTKPARTRTERISSDDRNTRS